MGSFSTLLNIHIGQNELIGIGQNALTFLPQAFDKVGCGEEHQSKNDRITI